MMEAGKKKQERRWNKTGETEWSRHRKNKRVTDRLRSKMKGAGV